MPRTTTVVIGAGQAGLAMSRCLFEAAIDHVVLERGQLAQRWRSQSWDSLRLLTPNWMTRLPGFQYDGRDPDGFMSARELITFFERYATTWQPPLIAGTVVDAVDSCGDGFRVVTSGGTWIADSVVVATGYCDRPLVPTIGGRLHRSVAQIAPSDYRRPEQLPPGGVLVVGASASGVQLADEIRRSGRAVTLAVGHHTRLPRQYRGRDIMWWLDRLGMLTRTMDAATGARHRRPSLQLVGRRDRASVDLATLHAQGVRLVGRLVDLDERHARFADDLTASAAAADVKMADTLTRIDEYIARTGIDTPPREPFEPTWPLAIGAPDALHLTRERIQTVVWATGYRRAYRWLHVPVLDERGEISHVGGVTRAAGLYVLGFNFQRRLNSSFIDGVGADARAIADLIARSVGATRVA